MGASKDQITKVRMAQGMTPEAYSDVEVEFLIDAAARLGLDPVQRQVWYQARADNKGVKKHQVLCTIDGLRVVAEKTGEYEGQTTPMWCGEDGQWVDVWTKSFEEMVAARVGVYRKGFREPVYAVARLSAFAQLTKDGAPMGQWGKMADHMTSKCAEALALRKAFPQQLSGVYTNDEMRAEEPGHEPAQPKPKPGSTGEEKEAEERQRYLDAMVKHLGEADIAPADWLRKYGTKSVNTLNAAEVQKHFVPYAVRNGMSEGEAMAELAKVVAASKR